MAVVNTAYVASGSGSGTWKKIPIAGLQGISASGTNNQCVASDGAGGTKLVNVAAHGGVYFINIGAPNVITYPSVYTKIGPTTAAVGATPVEVTEGTNARLTYTGTPNRHMVVSASAVITQSTGANRDVRLAIYKNGVIVPASETITTALTADKKTLDTFVDVDVATGDYLEAYLKNDGASGDISVYVFKLEVVGAVR